MYFYLLDINTLHYIKSTINTIINNEPEIDVNCTEEKYTTNCETFSNMNENFTNYNDNLVENFSNNCTDKTVIDSNGNIIPYLDNTFDQELGKNCEWYGTSGRCENNDITASYRNVSLNHSGLTAQNACCICGGGNTDNSPTPSPSYIDSPSPSSSNKNNEVLSFSMLFMGDLNTLSLSERERFIEQIILFLIEKGMSSDTNPTINLQPGSIIVIISLVDNNNSRRLVANLTTPGRDDYISPNNPVIINIGNGKIFTSYKVSIGTEISRNNQESTGEKVIIDMGDGNDILQFGTIGNSNIFLPMHHFS